MAHIRIDMHAFHDYILNMNQIVENIVLANKEFTDKIRELEEKGWQDDVYRRCHNDLFDLQETTNVFIDLLEELDCDLVVWYRRIFEEYANENYIPPVVHMGRVELIPALVMHQDQDYKTDPNIIAEYKASTLEYTKRIREEMDIFEEYHTNFSESFQTARYDAVTEDLRRPLQTMDEILDDMEDQANSVDEKYNMMSDLENTGRGNA